MAAYPRRYALGSAVVPTAGRRHAPALPEACSPRSDAESMTARRAGLAGAARESTLSVSFVRGLVQAMEQMGVPRVELLRAARIEAVQLEATEARLPRSEAYRIFEVAMDLTGDPALGLHLAEGLMGQAFGPTSHLVAHSANLRQAFESLHQFQRLLGDDPYFELREYDDQVAVCCLRLPGQSLRLRRFSAEMILTNFFRLIRYFSVQARPERVSFEYPAPPHQHEYARVFEHTERFEQPFTGIVLDRGLLDLSSPNKDEDVHEALRALAERRTVRLTQGAPYALRVREFLVEHGYPRRTDMETVARAIGLSVRSLRRRLASEGTSYSAVENDALAIVAKHLLRDKQRTIQETAYEMGFSDTTTFHRAFKRWTGTTPRAYRESE
jgi:AraC-like DNA-binding protein